MPSSEALATTATVPSPPGAPAPVGGSLTLVKVKGAAGAAGVASPDAGIGRAAVRGAVVGYFVVLALISTLVFTMAGVGLGTALAVGAYVAVWGGPGWGGMVAAQAHADRLEADELRAARSRTPS